MALTVAFASPITGSRALARVELALRQRAPKSVEFASVREANLVVFHVVGRRDHVRLQIRRLTRGQRYVVIQYALRSTQSPSTAKWLEVWNQAHVVWSYYDLRRCCREDGTRDPFIFYHAPLGVDSGVFAPQAVAQRYAICTNSPTSDLSEGARECAIACNFVGQRMANVGVEIHRPSADCYINLTDASLAGLYAACRYVSGLRRIEGFELPAAEGLLCGVRPVLYDRPHYRDWYGDWAEYVREESRPSVVEQLTALFCRTVRGVSSAEVREARRRFDWGPIAAGFWERCEA